MLMFEVKKNSSSFCGMSVVLQLEGAPGRVTLVDCFLIFASDYISALF